MSLIEDALRQQERTRGGGAPVPSPRAPVPPGGASDAGRRRTVLLGLMACAGLLGLLLVAVVVFLAVRQSAPRLPDARTAALSGPLVATTAEVAAVAAPTASIHTVSSLATTPPPQVAVAPVLSASVTGEVAAAAPPAITIPPPAAAWPEITVKGIFSTVSGGSRTFVVLLGNGKTMETGDALPNGLCLLTADSGMATFRFQNETRAYRCSGGTWSIFTNLASASP